jgi:hypothetical protein
MKRKNRIRLIIKRGINEGRQKQLRGDGWRLES